MRQRKRRRRRPNPRRRRRIQARTLRPGRRPGRIVQDEQRTAHARAAALHRDAWAALETLQTEIAVGRIYTYYRGRLDRELSAFWAVIRNPLIPPADICNARLNCNFSITIERIETVRGIEKFETFPGGFWRITTDSIMSARELIIANVYDGPKSLIGPAVIVAIADQRISAARSAAILKYVAAVESPTPGQCIRCPYLADCTQYGPPRDGQGDISANCRLFARDRQDRPSDAARRRPGLEYLDPTVALADDPHYQTATRIHETHKAAQAAAQAAEYQAAVRRGGISRILQMGGNSIIERTATK